MSKQDTYTERIAPYLSKIPEWYKTMTVQQIAKKMGISKSTLYKYAGEYKELEDALRAGKEDLVSDLKCAIKQRALGYSYVETTVKTTENAEGIETVTTKTTKHLPPDLGSIHLLLKNLDPDWHDADQITIKHRERELDIKEKRAEAEIWTAEPEDENAG